MSGETTVFAGLKSLDRSALSGVVAVHVLLCHMRRRRVPLPCLPQGRRLPSDVWHDLFFGRSWCGRIGDSAIDLPGGPRITTSRFSV